MPSYKPINPKFLQTINFHHHFNGQNLAGSLTTKVVRIQGPNDLHHPSMREAVELVTTDEFSKNFLKAGKAFVINLVVNGSLIPLDVQQLTSLSCYRDRPMIFHFENVKGDFCIYYSDKKSRSFKYLSKISEISIDDFFNSEFTFELLLRALKSKFCGDFNGKFLETSVNAEPLIDDFRLIDLAVMGNDVLCVRFLQVFESCLENLDVQSLRILQHAARSCDVDGFLGIFDLNFDCKEVKNKVIKEQLKTRDSSGYNLLMIACENSNIKGVMFLLNLSLFDVNYDVEGITAASLSKSPEILLMLLQNDSKYPKNFNKVSKSEELQLFTQKIAELHQAIRKSDRNCAKEILYNFRLRYFFNESNKSAAYTAIECQEFKIYEYLLINDASIAPTENIEDIQLDEVSRIVLKLLHEKYKSPLYERCVLDLERKIKCINVSEINRRKYQFELRNSLNILFDIEAFQPLLQITAASDVEITVDFERNSVNFLDPTEVKSTRGYFGSGAIYIGAKDLLDEDLRCLFLATFVHELTHFVINFLYGNQCRPFHASDRKRENDFKSIHEVCRRNAKREKLIEAVYGYQENLQLSELIVRPNHLRALYFDNEAMWRDFEGNFEALLSFYKGRIFVDMENALEWIEGDKRRDEDHEDENVWRKKRKYAEVFKDVEELNPSLTNFEPKNCDFSPNSDFKKASLSFCDRFKHSCEGNRLDVEISVPKYHSNKTNLDFEAQNSSLDCHQPLLNPLKTSLDRIKLIEQFEIEVDEPKDPVKRTLKLKIILLILAIAIISTIVILLSFPKPSNLPQAMRLTSSHCVDFSHPLSELIKSKNISAIEIEAEKSREMWRIDSPCNLLQHAIELHGDDFNFIEDLINTAEDVFENCKGNFKRLLIANGRILSTSEALGYEDVKNYVKITLSKLLTADELREFLNRNYENIGKNC